jgi:hypothetical protein
LAIYARLATLQPGSPQPYLQMAKVHRGAKNDDEALESLRAALSAKRIWLKPRKESSLSVWRKGVCTTHWPWHEMFRRQRPKGPVGYVFEGDIHASRKNWSEAASAYRTGLKQAESTDLATRLHTALAAGGNSAGAEQFAASWIKNHPTDGLFRVLSRASLHRRQGTTRARLQQYRKILEKEPNNALS